MICPVCKNEFQLRRRDVPQTYCSAKCTTAARAAVTHSLLKRKARRLCHCRRGPLMSGRDVCGDCYLESADLA